LTPPKEPLLVVRLRSGQAVPNFAFARAVKTYYGEQYLFDIV
jgi:hypothetical protein